MNLTTKHWGCRVVSVGDLRMSGVASGAANRCAWAFNAKGADKFDLEKKKKSQG